jgi:predicted RNA-binding protein Jag
MDLPEKRGSTKKAGMLTIEEYIQRRRETIMKYAQTMNIYGRCKAPQR